MEVVALIIAENARARGIRRDRREAAGVIPKTFQKKPLKLRTADTFGTSGGHSLFQTLASHLKVL